MSVAPVRTPRTPRLRTLRVAHPVQRPPEPPEDRPSWIDRISPREAEVLRCVACGLSNAEIAAELCISVATVKTHVARLLTKIRARDRVQLVVAAYRSGFLPVGERRARPCPLAH